MKGQTNKLSDISNVLYPLLCIVMAKKGSFFFKKIPIKIEIEHASTKDTLSWYNINELTVFKHCVYLVNHLDLLVHFYKSMCFTDLILLQIGV